MAEKEPAKEVNEPPKEELQFLKRLKDPENGNNQNEIQDNNANIPQQPKVNLANLYGLLESKGLVVEDEDDKIPPNIDKAKIHAKARKIYAAAPETEKKTKRKLCTCCGNAYDGERLSVCCSKSDMYHLGAGFPLYFEFIIFSSVLVIIMLVISGIYNVASSLTDHDCEHNYSLSHDDAQYCDKTWITKTALINKRFSENQLEVTDWLNLATVVVMIIAFQFYRRQAYLTAVEVDNSQQTPADYTIMISNLPLDATDQDIFDFIRKKVFPYQQVSVSKLVRGFKIGEFVKLERRKTVLQSTLSKKEVQNKEKFEKELDQIKARLNVLEQNSEKELEASSYVFITFEKEADAHEALKRLAFNPPIWKIFHYLGWQSCFKSVKFRDRVKLLAHKAPEPSDILWENLGTDNSEKNKRRLISVIVSAILILICGAIIVGLNFLKKEATDSDDNTSDDKKKKMDIGAEVISVLIALLIMIVNNSLFFSTRTFGTYESHSTFTGYFISVARRLSFATFVNTALTMLVTYYITSTLWKSSGLLNSVFVVFIVTLIIGPLSKVFNPWYFWRLYKRWEIKKQGANCPLTQRQANLLFEGPPVDMAQWYSNVMKIVWITAFYTPILPIGTPISLIGLFLTYWTDKYLLLNRYAKPTELGKTLSLSMTEDLELTPFFFAAGNIIFRKLILSNDLQDIDFTYLPSILALGLSVAHYILPCNPISRLFFKKLENNYSNHKTYSEMRVNFNNDYDISNPIYHDDALEDWLAAVEAADKFRHQALESLVKAEIKRSMTNKELARSKTGNQLKNLQNYAHRTEGLNAVGDARIQPQVPNRAMFFYNIDPIAAKLGNFILNAGSPSPGPKHFAPNTLLPMTSFPAPVRDNAYGPRPPSAHANYYPVNNQPTGFIHQQTLPNNGYPPGLVHQQTLPNNGFPPNPPPYGQNVPPQYAYQYQQSGPQGNYQQYPPPTYPQQFVGYPPQQLQYLPQHPQYPQQQPHYAVQQPQIPPNGQNIPMNTMQQPQFRPNSGLNRNITIKDEQPNHVNINFTQNFSQN